MAELIFNLIAAFLSTFFEGIAQRWANPGENENSPFLNKKEFEIKQDEKPE